MPSLSLSNLKIRPKLVLAFLLVGLVPVSIGGGIAYRNSADALERQSFEQLKSLRDVKKNAIADYFANARAQNATLAENPVVVDALREFRNAFHRYPGDPEAHAADLKSYYTGEFDGAYREANDGEASPADSLFGKLDRPALALQYAYIRANPKPLGQKHRLDDAGDGSEYSSIHRDFHPVLRNYLERFGYYDIFLADAETGHIVYSVFKELDFATSLLKGPYSESNIAEVFRMARETRTPGDVVMVDFANYTPSYEAPAAFTASPVFDGGRVSGVLIFQLPLDRISQVMAERSGLGETGETYLVGPDHLMRSDSYLDPVNHSVVASFRNPAKGRVDTEAAKAALAGAVGAGIIRDYNGNPVLSAYTPLDIGGLKWALLAEIDEAEAFAPVSRLGYALLLVIGVAAAATAIAGLFFAGTVANPVVSMTATMTRLAGRDMTAEIPARDRRDEIGAMAEAVQVFKDNMIEADRLAGEQRKEQEARAVRAQRIEELCNNFDATSSEAVRAVAAAASEMRSSSESMNATAGETTRQSAAVAAASEQASANVQTVASAAEELSSSISEIARQVEQSSRIASDAVRQAEQTNTKVQGLAEAADRIGEVVALITDIAEQTNLLALNATIEAARAGDAGKGFAVVASEVKNLANQTAKATDEIGTQIGDIQTATKEAVAAIAEITGTISEIDQISATVASAVEQQGAATQEIARNVEQAAAGTQEVSTNITGVSEAANDTGAAASQIQSAAGELSQQSERLRTEVDKFLGSVRAT